MGFPSTVVTSQAEIDALVLGDLPVQFRILQMWDTAGSGGVPDLNLVVPPAGMRLFCYQVTAQFFGIPAVQGTPVCIKLRNPTEVMQFYSEPAGFDPTGVPSKLVFSSQRDMQNVDVPDGFRLQTGVDVLDGGTYSYLSTAWGIILPA